MEHGISPKSVFFRVPVPGRFRTSFWEAFRRFLEGFLELLGWFSAGFWNIFGEVFRLILLRHCNVFDRCLAECCTDGGSISFRFVVVVVDDVGLPGQGYMAI